MNTWSAISERRRELASFLRTVDEKAWATPSLCAGWSVREVVGHLISPLEGSKGAMAGAFLKAGGRFDRAMDLLARKYAAKPTEELVAALEKHAEHRFVPPFGKPVTPLADTVLHTIDIRWPLGAPPSFPDDQLVAVLDFLVSGKAGSSFVTHDRHQGLALKATDLDWSHGDGPAVTGPADALAMAIAGRQVALEKVGGEGVDVLRGRLAGR